MRYSLKSESSNFMRTLELARIRIREQLGEEPTDSQVAVFTRLKIKDIKILKMLYNRDMSRRMYLKDVAAHYGVSSERIGQRRDTAITRLHYVHMLMGMRHWTQNFHPIDNDLHINIVKSIIVEAQQLLDFANKELEDVCLHGYTCTAGMLNSANRLMRLINNTRRAYD